jgi:hypothetical protein
MGMSVKMLKNRNVGKQGMSVKMLKNQNVGKNGQKSECR